jgi:hypothetical protein
VEQLDEAGLHVEAAGAGGGVADDAERPPAQGADRPDRVVVAEEQHPRPAVPPDEVVAGAFGYGAEQVGAEGGDRGRAGRRGGVVSGRGLDGDERGEVRGHAAAAGAEQGQGHAFGSLPGSAELMD